MRESKLLWRQRRALALLLTLCLLLTCMPLPALSVNETAACAGEAANASDEVYIVGEDVTKRGEFEKHFLCSDGTYRAVTYAEPVHHYDSAAGAWQDNDVSLALNAASARYEAQSGSFAVSFAKSYAAPAAAVTSDASGSLTADGGITQNAASAETSALPSAQTVTMTNGTYPISWTTAVKPSLSVTEGSTAIQRSALDAPKLLTRTPAASILTSAEAEAAAQQSFAGKPISDADAFAAANRVSVAEYASVAQVPGQGAGVSLRYSVSQHKIKEDIIIANRSAVTDFVTTLDIGALTAAAQDDGSVLLVDEYGNTAYTVGVPYLYDADYNVSYDAAVTVEQTGSICRITYAPNREWLDDTNRAYPVVLDPTVTSSEYYANIVDTYVTQADSNNHSAEGNLVVGIKSGNLNRAYIRINNLPSLPDEVLPLSANLTIKHGANTTTGRTMSLYRTNSSWSPTTITYNNQPSSVTSVASCAFNTANVSFTLSQSQIQDLYSRKANGTNYGYQIRYTSESTTNPDYNMLRSMEYPTASEQPLFTVNYGYSLPVGLVEGTVYSFKNVGSSLYLDVCGGTDADNNNVAQYKGNSTVSQDFKLEKSSTGNGYILRAQVGGKTRVLDIYKTNGRVENGNNVQIYRNVDPIAQEWLIIPVNSANYKIVPRSNPALALTSYGSSNGSASGKSTTSAGNVFVSTYTGHNTNQWWSIERENGVFIQPGTTLLEDGEYYLNSRSTSKYLRNVSGSVQGANGTTAALGTSIKWKFTNMGGKYLIQPANNTSLYLSGGSTTDNSVRLVTLASSIPSECLWTVTKSNLYSNQITIKSNIGRTLCSIGSSINAEIYPPMNDEWRFVKTSEMKELSTISLNLSKIECYETKVLSVSTSLLGCSFAEVGDFTYQSLSSNLSLTQSGTVVRVTGNSVGNANIKVTYKVTGQTMTSSITVSPYQFTVGLSTDNYNAGCQAGSRGSYTYASVFMEKFSLQNSYMEKNYIQKSNLTSYGGASKNNFRYTGNTSNVLADSVDFMVYIGHGGRASNSKGNSLHYNFSSSGISHTEGCNDEVYNLYTSEVKFGSSTSKLRWVWLYTCNFLTESSYVTHDDLKEMMDGAHIVMGYASQAYLCSDVAEMFAEKLSGDSYIINSFFAAGDQAESQYADDNHIQKVLYMTGTRYEKITSPPNDYGTHQTNTVAILTNGIHDSTIWN